jgi:hypothetical protein
MRLTALIVGNANLTNPANLLETVRRTGVRHSNNEV